MMKGKTDPEIDIEQLPDVSAEKGGKQK